MNHSRRLVKDFQRLRQWMGLFLGPGLGPAALLSSAPIHRNRRPPAAPLAVPSLFIEPLENRELLTATIFFEGFEEPFPTTNGWTVADTNPLGTPAYWGAVDAAFGGEGTTSGNGKGYCAGVGYGGTTVSPTNQPGMQSSMSITLDLSDHYEATLEFWYKNKGGGSSQHFFKVELDSTVLTQSSLSGTTNWVFQTISLEAYIGGVYTLRFYYSTGSVGPGEGLYLDDILVTGADVDPDPDDAIYQAFDLGAIPDVGLVTRVDQAIDNIDDVDLVRFTAQSGQTLGFDVDLTPGSGLDSYITLFDASGVFVASTSSGVGIPPEPASNEAYMQYVFTSSGTYYLGVSSSSNDNYRATNGTGDSDGNSTGGYILHIGDMDPDDVISQAYDLGQMPLDGVITRTGQALDHDKDVDMMSFAVVAGQTLGFDIDTPIEGLLDGTLLLFNALGQVRSGSQFGFGPSPETRTSDPYFEFTFPASGIYYIAVSSGGNVSYNPINGLNDNNNTTYGDYTLHITNRIDSDDSISEAVELGALPAGGMIVHADQVIDRSTDVDMVAFTVAAGQIVGFDIDRRTGSDLKSYIRLFDSAGTMLGSNNDQVGPSPEASSTDSYFEYTFNAAGTFFLGVSADTNI